MKSLEDVLIHVLHQAMVEGARSVEIEDHSYPHEERRATGLETGGFSF
jgi:hypothetical protein